MNRVTSIATGFVPSFLRPIKPLKWYDVPSRLTRDVMGTKLPFTERVVRTDDEEPLGLVLSGGGAKGAYQAGVWSALATQGLARRIRAISGTSVGALNALAFAVLDSPDDMRRLWHTYVGTMVSPNFDALSPENLIPAIIGGLANGEIPLTGLLSRDALGGLLDNILLPQWTDTAPDVYVSSLECLSSSLGLVPSIENYRLVRFWLNGEMNHLLRRNVILASCAMPWCFSPVEIGGRLYVDGGWEQKGGDNLPIRPILVRHPEIKTIIVVRCNSVDIESTRLPVVPGVRFIEIRPRRPLRGIFDDLIETLPEEWCSNILKSRSGTFAFDSAFTDEMFTQGTRDGHSIIPQN